MARRRKRDSTELSAFLDRLLKEKGLTHTQFSRKVGMSPSSVSDLKLRQVSSVEDQKVAKVFAKVLDLSADEHHQLFHLLELSRCPAYIQEQVKQGRPAKAVKWVAEPPLDYHCSGVRSAPLFPGTHEFPGSSHRDAAFCEVLHVTRHDGLRASVDGGEILDSILEIWHPRIDRLVHHLRVAGRQGEDVAELDHRLHRPAVVGEPTDDVIDVGDADRGDDPSQLALLRQRPDGCGVIVESFPRAEDVEEDVGVDQDPHLRVRAGR